MNIGIEFILGVALIVTQISSLGAVDPERQCEKRKAEKLRSDYNNNHYPSIFQIIRHAGQSDGLPGSKDVEVDPVVKNVTSSAEQILIQDLKAALSANDYRRVFDISEQIYINLPVNMFQNFIKQAIEGSFDKINATKFLISFNCHKYEVQKIYAYSAMIKQLESRNELNKSLAVTLTFNFKMAFHQLCSSSSDARDCSIVRSSWLELLPRDLKLLPFAESLCIQSKKTKQFLNSGDVATHPGTRKLKTVGDERPMKNVSWIVKPFKDVLRLQSSEKKEYVSVAEDYYDFDKNRARVELKSQANGIRSDWVFELSGDAMYIKNPSFKTYLYVNTQERDGDVKNKDYVFASYDKFDESLWKFYVC